MARWKKQMVGTLGKGSRLEGEIKKNWVGLGYEWQTLTLADVCTVITDGAHQSPKTVSRGKPMASVKDLTRFGIDLTSARHIATEDFEALVKQGCKPHVGDVLIAKDGNSALDTVCTVDHPLDAVLLSSVAILRPDPKCLDSVFLKFYLSSPETIDYLKSNFISGAAIPRVVLRDFKRAEIRLPSLDVQRRIARVLQSIDSKIDLNRRINQTLEAMAQAIFQSWFVDFEPVKAKIAAIAEGRDPLRAAMGVISGKPEAQLDALPPEQYDQLAATAALFPDEMEESELGEIPKGWEVSCISQFGDVVCGKTPSKANPEYFGEGIPFIKIPDMHNSMYVVSPSERLTALGAASQAKKTIPSGSICVSCIATVGKVVITHDPSQTNQQINSIVPKFPQYTAYLYFQMTEKEKEFHDLASGGSATLNMNTSTFSKVSVLMPNFEILTKFSVLVAPFFSEILSRQKESAILSETRDTILPKLLSGELSVIEAMAEAEA
ncbi:restriction endonuclease subunit S [Rhodoferax sp.]|uniref:restriction endonuclease subunit S n=1 Tax=Rhodoferax sp. TaxID=50421 RepID=UPI0026166400|nr:restriction endonuclease subunit S [Rhodoferax sp.]MDD2925781.1 restriction endonuclease subunit S [Rhodoferax sp.]